MESSNPIDGHLEVGLLNEVVSVSDEFFQLVSQWIGCVNTKLTETVPFWILNHRLDPRLRLLPSVIIR